MHNNYKIVKKEYRFKNNFYKRHELSKEKNHKDDFIDYSDCKICKSKYKVNRKKTCLKLMEIPRRINRQDHQMISDQKLLIEKDYRTISP